nr:hypothetical protein [Micromonospora sp. DSM 115978]
AVRQEHADLTPRGWAALTSLVGAKWTATVEPDAGVGRGDDHGASSTRVVAFTETDPQGADGTPDPATALVRWVLHRAHGKIGNVWRDGLVRVRNTTDGQRLSKREARAVVEAAVQGGVPSGDPGLLDARLADL